MKDVKRVVFNIKLFLRPKISVRELRVRQIKELKMKNKIFVNLRIEASVHTSPYCYTHPPLNWY